VQVFLSLFFAVVVYRAKKIISFRFFSPIIKPIISALIMGAASLLLSFFLPYSLITIGILGVFGCITYIAILYFLFKINVINEIKMHDRLILCEMCARILYLEDDL